MLRPCAILLAAIVTPMTETLLGGMGFLQASAAGLLAVAGRTLQSAAVEATFGDEPESLS